MTNHVHLLLTPARAEGCALLMKNLGQRYVQYVNRAYQRSGTLWEGRFRSCLLQAEDYVLACYRYIELNPVRANMVRHPREYRWSSYRSNAEGRGSRLLVTHEQYERLARTDEARREAYRELFRAHEDQTVVEQLRAATNGGYVLGNGRFQSQIAKALGRRVVPGKAGRPRSKSRQDTEGQSAE
jgi:putative transposase